MSIQTAIENAQQKVANAYTAVNNKGGTLPATQNLSNLPTAINTISTGISPTGTISITENGVFDVTNYATADVDVSGGGEGQYLVQVIDYDGTVLKSEKLDTGNTFTLPSNPSHSNLVFQNWSSPVAITNNTVTVTDSDITIGATYTTASGLSEFDITLTAVTGLTVTLKMNGTKNWGDGTSDTSTTHTYASEGNYTITCNGTTMTTSSSSGIVGQSSSNNARYILTSARLANITSIGSYAFYYCYSLTSITIPSGVTSIGIGAFYYCYSLTSITIPDSVTSIGKIAFCDCYSLTSITIPDSVTSIGDTTFYRCYSLTSITIPSGVTSISDSMLSDCYSLTSITIPSGVTSIMNTAFYYCYSLTSITIPDSVTSIGDTTFYYCYSIIEYDFSNHTSVPTLSNTNAFLRINGICKIKVPSALYNNWITATNWSTYANYIVGV